MPDDQSNIVPGTPAPQAIDAGKGGIVPPASKRWKPGQSGNPAGRKSAGAYVKEHVNALSGATGAKLLAIAKNPKVTWRRRAAATRMLLALEFVDMADFEPLLKGQTTLQELRASGVNTLAVKKIKQKSRRVPVGGGEMEEVIEREIELHDRSGNDFDRIMDQTTGKPKQAVDLAIADDVPFTLHIGAVRPPKEPTGENHG